MLAQRGVLETTLLDAGPFVDADFTRAIKAGKADDLLAKCEPRLKLRNKNLIFDSFVPFTYYRAGWSSAGAPPSPYNQASGNWAYFAFIALLTYDSEPTYQEFASTENYYGRVTDVYGNVGSGNMKWFINSQIEPWVVWADGGGREMISFRNRWLYLPSEAVSSNINSLGIYFWDYLYNDGYNSSDYHRGGRIRFKDAGDNPITIVKTSNQVLLLEYTWHMMSV